MVAPSKKQRLSQGRLEAEPYNAATLYAQVFAEPEFLIEKVLLAGRLTFFVGRPKSLKTWLVLELAVAVALNRRFLAYTVTTPGRVLTANSMMTGAS